jgi:N-acyl homoserine lactone hydrolase
LEEKEETMNMKMARMLCVTVLGLFALAFVGPTTARAQDPRIYVFTSGSMAFPKAYLQDGAEGMLDRVPVGFYVIKHPKGNILFDLGNSEKTVENADAWWGPVAKAMGLKMTKDDLIPAQLAKIGLKTTDIKYVILSHMHGDHTGGVPLFPHATFLVQNDELKAAWYPDPGNAGSYCPGDYIEMSDLKFPGRTMGWSSPYNIIRLEGDLDLFGDGSVRIFRAPGHSAGSQFAVVRLKKTGSVILTGDVVYLKENLDKNLLPHMLNYWSPVAMYKSYQRVRLIRDTEGAQIFFSHDPEVFKASKKAPEFYD